MDFLPIQVPTERQGEFPGLHRRFSLVTYFLHSIDSVNMSVPSSQFIPAPFPLSVVLNFKREVGVYHPVATSQKLCCPCSHCPALHLSTSLCQKSRWLSLWGHRPLPYCSLQPEANFPLLPRASRRGKGAWSLESRTISESGTPVTSDGCPTGDFNFFFLFNHTTWHGGA